MTSCRATVPDLDASGDNFYGPSICWDAFIEWAWDAFDFDKGDWDHGFGYEAVCDNRLPLSRTLSAIYCLQYSAEDYRNESYDSDILQWGCRYARNEIDELDARCPSEDSPGAGATTFTGPRDNRTELYPIFFYRDGVPIRAATLVHEARHAGGGPDHDWNDTNDSSWGLNGSWRWEVCWLAWFYVKGTRTTAAMREMARQRANGVLNLCFKEHPGFNY